MGYPIRLTMTLCRNAKRRENNKVRTQIRRAGAIDTMCTQNSYTCCLSAGSYMHHVDESDGTMLWC